MSWLGVSNPFPPRIAFGVQCRPGWSTAVAVSAGGHESRNQNWQRVRHTYDASLAIRTATDYALAKAHFMMARGRLHTWPLKDPLDHRCEQASGIVATAEDESPSPKQLFKRYGSGDYLYDRKITRPRQGTIQVYGSGVLLTEGAQYTLDYDTGEIVTGVAVGTLAWSGQFWTPCRYDIDEFPAAIVNRHPGGGELLVSVAGIPIVEDRDE